MLPRRELCKTAVCGSLFLAKGSKLTAESAGIRLGVISYSFRGLINTATSSQIDTVLHACQACKLSHLELTAPMVEPTPPQGRDELRSWRLSTPEQPFRDVRRKCQQAGIDLFAYVMTFTDDFSNQEIDAVFRQAKILGVQIVGTNQTKVNMAARLAIPAAKHKIKVAFHNHAKSADSNEVASPTSFEKIFAISPWFYANLDVGHFVAGNNDPIAFIQHHHKRITHLHLKDRFKNDGPNVRWSQGDTPLKEILTLIRAAHYPLYCVIEYEYRGAASPIEEVTKCVKFVDAALA